MLNILSRFLAVPYWFGVSILLLIVLVWLSWQGLKLHDFQYSHWYDWLNINQHIVVYAPQNLHYLGLEHLTKAEHTALFGHIVDAIHQHGQGLSEIVFYYGTVLQPLLTQAEITHLQDVANLIDVANRIVLLSFLLVVLLLLYPLFNARGYPKFNAKTLCCVYLLISAFFWGSIIVLGPTTVFYWLHTIIFPVDHQWFFYYQDSLMTTLMKAPDLFGAIGATLVLYSLVLGTIIALLVGGLTKLLKNR